MAPSLGLENNFDDWRNLSLRLKQYRWKFRLFLPRAVAVKLNNTREKYRVVPCPPPKT